jgi:hypothetical protein
VTGGEGAAADKSDKAPHGVGWTRGVMGIAAWVVIL